MADSSLQNRNKISSFRAVFDLSFHRNCCQLAAVQDFDSQALNEVFNSSAT